MKATIHYTKEEVEEIVRVYHESIMRSPPHHNWTASQEYGYGMMLELNTEKKPCPKTSA